MSAVQGWLFLLLLVGLAARGGEGVRLRPVDVAFAAAAAALAVVQKLWAGQVTLDDPLVAPLFLALPLVAAYRGGARRGVAAALGIWLALAVLGGAVATRGGGEISQDGYVLATAFALVLAGAAGALPPARRWLGALVPAAWIAFFALRDDRLVLAPAVVAVPLLAVAWAAVGAAFIPAEAAQ